MRPRLKTYADLPGDGGARVLEQVLEQRKRITAALAGVRRVVALGSGKGGVGKSTLTACLAIGLRRAGRRVCVLDADLNGPCMARVLGCVGARALPGEGGLLVPKTAHGIGVLSFGSFLGETEPLEFSSVAAGDSFTWRATKEFTTLAEILEKTDWGEQDILLVDLPPGAERFVQYGEFFGPDASLVMITTPSVLAQEVVQRSLRALEKSGGRMIGYIENMSGYFCADCGAVKPLFKTSPDLRPKAPCLGTVPFDPQLADVELMQRANAGEQPLFTEAIFPIIRELERRLETGDEVSVC